jgi:hypothetical protein
MNAPHCAPSEIHAKLSDGRHGREGHVEIVVPLVRAVDDELVDWRLTLGEYPHREVRLRRTGAWLTEDLHDAAVPVGGDVQHSHAPPGQVLGSRSFVMTGLCTLGDM